MRRGLRCLAWVLGMFFTLTDFPHASAQKIRFTPQRDIESTAAHCEELIRRFQGLPHKSRLVVLQDLPKYGPLAAGALPTLWEMYDFEVAEPELAARERAQIIEVIAAVGIGDLQVFRSLARVAKSNAHAKVRRAAVLGVSELHFPVDSSYEFLQAFLDDKEELVREGALAGLTRLDVNWRTDQYVAKGIRQAVIAKCADPSAQVKAIAVEQAEKMFKFLRDPQDVIEALIPLLENEQTYQTPVSNHHMGSRRISVAAAWALSEIPDEAGAAAGKMLALANSQSLSDDSQVQVIHAYVRLTQDKQMAADLLRPLLDSADSMPDFRIENLIQEIGPGYDLYHPVLITWCRDDFASFRIIACDALAGLREDAEPALAVLSKLAENDEDEEVRTAAARAVSIITKSLRDQK